MARCLHFFQAHRKQAITKPPASVKDEYKNAGRGRAEGQMFLKGIIHATVPSLFLLYHPPTPPLTPLSLACWMSHVFHMC
jgi:hypothetical protein